MTLGKQMIEQLQLLAAGKTVLELLPAQAAEYKRLAVLDAGDTAALEFFDHDRYSVALRAIEVGAGAAARDVRAYLSAAAAAVAPHLSFLEEPLAVWELDSIEGTAQLRSSPPLREGDGVSYWEVILTAGAQPAARALRYRWAPGMAEREVVAYPATFALVGRVADSLAAALQGAEG
jgi:hypothetical protein